MADAAAVGHPADMVAADAATGGDGVSDAALAAAVASLLAVTGEELVAASAAAGRLSAGQAAAVRAVLRRLDTVGHPAGGASDRGGGG